MRYLDPESVKICNSGWSLRHRDGCYGAAAMDGLMSLERTNEGEGRPMREISLPVSPPYSSSSCAPHFSVKQCIPEKANERDIYREAVALVRKDGDGGRGSQFPKWGKEEGVY